MYALSRILVVTLSALVLLPAAASAQVMRDPPMPPVPPLPCGGECWWPVGAIAQLDALKADIEVTDGTTVAHYRFELSNPSPGDGFEGATAEGRIVFPVPPGSSVTDLVLSGGPETLEGTLLDDDEATALYEEIVQRMIDPALLRSLEGDLYEVRAFPVPPGEERQVSFTVTTPLLAEGEEAIVSVPWSRMSPRPGAAQVSVDVEVPWEVRSAIAPGFELDEERKGEGGLGLSWESGDGWTAGTDFALHLAGGEGLVDTRLLAYREAGEDGYFSLLFAPVLEVDASVARDIVLVIDRSGSMEGEKMAQAISAAGYVLDHLGANDRFAVVDFSRYVHSFDESLRPAADAKAGIEYVSGLSAGGNTNISGALERGMAYLDGERPGTIIFLTDGLPTVGLERAEDILDVTEAAAPERTQLFAFGVGYDVDTILLDALAQAFVGSSTYVAPEERVDSAVAALYEQVSTPVLSDVSISIDGVETFDLAPEAIPGIFAGNQALLTGRYSGAGPATVRVDGQSVDGPVSFTYEVVFPAGATDEPAIAQLWAQRTVADLLTELRLEGERDSLIEEIVDVATQFGIVTPYTAYLAQEPEIALDDGAAVDALRDFSAEAAAAPAAGQEAVARAKAVSDLYAGDVSTGQGGQGLRTIGTHAFYLVDGTWTRDDYEADTLAPELAVGTPEFLALVQADPDLAEAAALGERVVTQGPDGWITLVWPTVDAVE